MYIQNPQVDKLLARSFGHPGSVAVPSPVAEGEQWGPFPSGVQETLNHMFRAVQAESEPEIINWYFLVGAPGNGKSESLRYICKNLGIDHPQNQPGAPAPRTIPELWPDSALNIGRTSLVLINDASVPRRSLPPGVLSLTQDLIDAGERIERYQTPVIVCNVNRGVLIEEAASATNASTPGYDNLG